MNDRKWRDNSAEVQGGLILRRDEWTAQVWGSDNAGWSWRVDGDGRVDYANGWCRGAEAAKETARSVLRSLRGWRYYE
jgi:hypothetical protein